MSQSEKVRSRLQALDERLARLRNAWKPDDPLGNLNNGLRAGYLLGPCDVNYRPVLWRTSGVPAPPGSVLLPNDEGGEGEPESILVRRRPVGFAGSLWQRPIV